MTKNDTKTPAETPRPGPSVTAWLAEVLGVPRASKTPGPIRLPNGFHVAPPPCLRIPLNIPNDVILSDGGELRFLEIRDLPTDISLSLGERGEDGVWRITPDLLDGLFALVPAARAESVSLTLKGLFSSLDGDESWAELTGIELTINDTSLKNIDATTLDDTLAEPENTGRDSQLAVSPPTLVAIDLDVSVGIEDPEALAKITVTFDGLPEGGSLNVGETDGEGLWLVSASDLKRLSILVPENTPSFDLTIGMDADDGTSQTATIYVETETAIENGDDANSIMSIRLAPPQPPYPLRFKVFIDGNPAFDQVISWPEGADVPVDILVPDVLETRRPFEIVMRYEPMEAGRDDGPSLLGIDIHGNKVLPDSPLIAARGHVDAAGRTWHGDLIVNARALDAPPAQQPTMESAPSISPAPITAPAPFEIQSQPVPQNIEPPTDIEPPVQTVAPTPPVATTAAPAKPRPTNRSDVLIVDASTDDLRSPAFLDELRGLRDFIQAHAEGATDDVYDRLGIDVKKWRAMEVRGPAGIIAEIDPMLPALTAPGGIDNTRAIQPFFVTPPHRPSALAVRISGLAPGTMLTHGENLGDGTWLIVAADIAKVSVLPPVRAAKLASAYAKWLGLGDAQMQTSSLLYGTQADVLQSAATGMLTLELELDTAVFDPDGYGSLSITVGDMPPGILLARGSNHGGGVWTVESVPGDTLLFCAAVGTMPFKVTMTSVALDKVTGASTVVTRSIDAVPKSGRVGITRTMAA